MARRKTDEPRVDYHIVLPVDLAQKINDRSARKGETARRTIITLLRSALAAEEMEGSERRAVPIIRAAVGEDQAVALEAFRQQIRADVQEVTQKHIDRLAALLVRSARATSLTWRLIYRLIQRQYGPAVAQTWYEEEYAKAGKAMATRTNSGKEIER